MVPGRTGWSLSYSGSCYWFKSFAKGFLKLASILIGMIIGYIFSSFFGMVSFSNVAQAGVFQLPQVLHFGITFEPSACIALGLLFVINLYSYR